LSCPRRHLLFASKASTASPAPPKLAPSFGTSLMTLATLRPNEFTICAMCLRALYKSCRLSTAANRLRTFVELTLPTSATKYDYLFGTTASTASLCHFHLPLTSASCKAPQGTRSSPLLWMLKKPLPPFTFVAP
jgi:hypothetical protein